MLRTAVLISSNPSALIANEVTEPDSADPINTLSPRSRQKATRVM